MKIPKTIDNLASKLSIYALAVPIVLLHVLVAIGCLSLSPGLSNIFLLQLSHNQTASAVNSVSQVRIGYFGLCAGPSSNLTCAGFASDQFNSTALPTNGSTSTAPQSSSFTTSHLDLASTLRSSILSCLIVVAGFIFTLGITFLSVVKCHQRKTRQRLRTSKVLTGITLALLWSATLLSIVATASITQTAAALVYLSSRQAAKTTIERGTTLQVLQWLLAVLSLVFTAGVTLLLQHPAINRSYVVENDYDNSYTRSTTELVGPLGHKTPTRSYKAPYPSSATRDFRSTSEVGFTAPTPQGTFYGNKSAVAMPTAPVADVHNRWAPPRRTKPPRRHRASALSFLQR